MESLQPRLSNFDKYKLECIHDNIIYQYYLIISKFDDSNEKWLLSLCEQQSKLLSFLRSRLRPVLTVNDLIGILIYMVRLSHLLMDTYLSYENINYIILVIVILYCKMYSDFPQDNNYYARLTRSNLTKINRTEALIFNSIQLVISKETFEKYDQDLETKIHLEILN